MRYGTWVRLWIRQLWIEVTEQPALLVPHPHKVEGRHGPGDGYRCSRCGSRSARVQAKGQRQAQSLRGMLS